MFAFEVHKDTVSLWGKGRAGLFATLPKIKTSYTGGSSAARQTHGMRGLPMGYSALPHGS